MHELLFNVHDVQIDGFLGRYLIHLLKTLAVKPLYVLTTKGVVSLRVQCHCHGLTRCFWSNGIQSVGELRFGKCEGNGRVVEEFGLFHLLYLTGNEMNKHLVVFCEENLLKTEQLCSFAEEPQAVLK